MKELEAARARAAASSYGFFRISRNRLSHNKRKLREGKVIR